MITIIKCDKFTTNKIGENVHYSFIQDRNFFVDSVVVKQSLPTDHINWFFDTFSICFFVKYIR